MVMIVAHDGIATTGYVCTNIMMACGQRYTEKDCIYGFYAIKVEVSLIPTYKSTIDTKGKGAGYRYIMFTYIEDPGHKNKTLFTPLLLISATCSLVPVTAPVEVLDWYH